MLSAPFRLRGDQQFKRILTRGMRVFSKTLMLRAVENGEKVSRFAFVVSTKVSKKTVERNRLKRRLREIVRRAIPSVRTGFDILIITRREALALSFASLREELLQLLSKARLLKT